MSVQSTLEEVVVPGSEESSPVVGSTPKARWKLPARFHYIFITMLLVVGIDQVVKLLAVKHLVHNQVTNFGPFVLKLVYNPGDVVDPHASPIANVLIMHVLTLLLMVVCITLFRSKIAGVGAGLCLGGMFGNLASLLIRPRLVPDFLVVGSKICNMADLSIALGIIIISCACMWEVIKLFRRASVIMNEKKGLVQAN
jgi:lipoprotein signal peptidase